MSSSTNGASGAFLSMTELRGPEALDGTHPDFVSGTGPARGRPRALSFIVMMLCVACTPSIEDGDASGSLDGATVDSPAAPPQCPGDGELVIRPETLAAHLDAFEAIAAAHRDRAAGTPGFDASVAYVISTLSEAGLSPWTETFEVDIFALLAPPVLEAVGDSSTEAIEGPEMVISYHSGSGTGEGVPLRVGDSNPGCSACDVAAWADVPAGSVVVARGAPSDVRTLFLLAGLGHVAALLVETESDTPERPWEVVRSGALIPIVLVGHAAATRLLAANSVRFDVSVDLHHTVSTANVFADLPGLEDDHRVMVGAHLDSVPDAPGINDNGTGVASVLALASALGACELRHPVRLAFWGAEEWGLVGSRHWVESASPDELTALSAYLNLDMVGSPNGGTFVLGDRETGMLGAWLADSYASRGEGVAWDTFSADRSDHRYFREAGVPVAGVAAGAEGLKTEEEAALFGGEAGQPYDACYHRSCDTRDRVDEARTLLAARGIGRLTLWLTE